MSVKTVFFFFFYFFSFYYYYCVLHFFKHSPKGILGDPGAVGQVGRKASKVLKNGWESRQDAILNAPILRLIRMLVSDWAQKIFLCPIIGKHLSLCFCDFLIRRSLPVDSTVQYLSGSCVGAFFEKNFSVQIGPTKPKISHNLACEVRFPYNRIHLSCRYVSNLFILTSWEKKYEIVAYIVNLWGYTEILPNLKCTNRRNQNVDWWKVNSLTLEYL